MVCYLNAVFEVALADRPRSMHPNPNPNRNRNRNPNPPADRPRSMHPVDTNTRYGPSEWPRSWEDVVGWLKPVHARLCEVAPTLPLVVV